MLKYIKKAYIMSIMSYNETPNGVVEEQKNKLEDLSSFDELTNQLLKTQEDLISNPGNKELIAKLNQILEERTQEGERLKGLYNPELVTNFITEQLQNYSAKLNGFQNIRLARIDAQKNRQEKIASIEKPIKEFANDMLKKAKNMVRYSENPDFKNKGFDLKIEDGKVVLYNPEGKRLKYFTIPTMNEDGTINNEENKDRLDNPLVGFNDFVKKYVDVKTYAEIGQENIQNAQEIEKIASLNNEVKLHNKMIFGNLKRNISELGQLPNGIDVSFNSENNHVEITLNNKIISFYTPNIKDTSGNLINTENKNIQRNASPIFKKWVYDNIKKVA